MRSGLARTPASFLHMIHHLIVLLLLVLLILKDEAADADVRARLGELLLLRGPLLFLELNLLPLSKSRIEDLLGQLKSLIVRWHSCLSFTLLLHLHHINMVEPVY